MIKAFVGILLSLLNISLRCTKYIQYVYVLGKSTFSYLLFTLLWNTTATAIKFPFLYFSTSHNRQRELN